MNCCKLGLLFLCIQLTGVASYQWRSMLPRSLQMNLLHAKSSHQFEIFAKNIAVTNEMKERLTKKVGKVLSKLGNDAVRTHVVLRFDPHRGELYHSL